MKESILKSRMSQHNPEEIVYHYRWGKEIPDYYSFREELYCGTFPEEWARTHKPGTGPHDCRECLRKGSWNGVFIGYCSKCAHEVYRGERGRGFITIGEEDKKHEYFSAFESYLYQIMPDDVGDKDFMDSAEVVNTMAKTEFLESLVSLEIEEMYHKIHVVDTIEYVIDRVGDKEKPVLQ
jgi:hypothetical protein